MREDKKAGKVSEAFLLSEAIKQIEKEAKQKRNKIVICKAPYFGRFRWDFFGVFDLIVITNYPFNSYRQSDEVDATTEFIQVTTKHHLSDRRKKILNFFQDAGCYIPHASIWAYD